MTRAQLEHAIRAAGAICGDRELYVVGSQAILGTCADAHPDLLRSMEVDVAPKHRPELESLIEGSIGELSPFHKTFGFYVDGVDIDGIVLPEGWRGRVVVVDNANTNGIRGLCLDPTDLAVTASWPRAPEGPRIRSAMLLGRVVRPETLHERVDAVATVDATRKAALQSS